MVNIMSHEEDHCFQCQEQGHITQNCPHIRCYECDECGHIVMDCPHRIPPSGTPVTHHKPHRSHHARSSLRHHHEDRDRWSQSRSNLTFKDIAAQAIAICMEATLDHNIEIDAAITEMVHDDLAQSTEDTATYLTNHITYLPNLEALVVIDPNIIVGHTHDHPIGLQDMNHINQVHNPAEQGENHIPRKTWGWR